MKGPAGLSHGNICKLYQLVLLTGWGLRILKFPADMKIAYMQQEADLDNSKTAFEDSC